MSKVKIITDSTSDLPFSLLEEYGIARVPLHIILGDDSYLDDENFESAELFRFADRTGVLPKSAAANQFEYIEFFSKWLDEGYDIFFMGISSKLSANMQNALAAAEQLDKNRIAIVDSLSLSTGIGLQVLEAAELARDGADLNQITAHIESIRPKVQASFVVDTLKYLYMGGRCSRLASVVGSTLKIKPMLELIDGEIVPGPKFRGNNYIKKYCSMVLSKPDKINPKRIFVTHCMSPAAPDVKKMLQEKYGFENVMITDASPTISTHCGPGTLGVLYIYK